MRVERPRPSASPLHLRLTRRPSSAIALVIRRHDPAFHDLREAHAARDWIMLVASALVLFQFARQFWNRNLRHS
jgi:hypothetical protein